MRIKKVIKIRRKDGFEFVGTPRECAELMLPDAQMSSHTLGGIGDMILDDFCRQHGLEVVRDVFGRDWHIRERLAP